MRSSLEAQLTSLEVPLLYRVADAVRATGLCRSKIYELIAAGDLRTVHFGRAVRITAESLHTLIARRTEPARQAPAPRETKTLLTKALSKPELSRGKSAAPGRHQQQEARDRA